jgi:hypothetical protein
MRHSCALRGYIVPFGEQILLSAVQGKHVVPGQIFFK